MNSISILLALLTGASVALQAVLNARLRTQWGLLPALLLSLTVTLVPILVVWVTSGAPLPSRAVLSNTSPVIMIGGLFGIVVITGSAIVYNRLGAVTALTLVILGQFTAGALVDHFGLFGAQRSPITLSRGAALALMVGAALLSRR